jgi:hypothetical protein
MSLLLHVLMHASVRPTLKAIFGKIIRKENNTHSKSTSVSEEHVASIFRAKESTKQETIVM